MSVHIALQNAAEGKMDYHQFTAIHIVLLVAYS